MVRLEKRHFKKMVCLYGFGWISNGHWMVRQSAVSNGAIFDCAPKVVAAALGLSEEGYFAPRQFQSEAEPQKGLSAIATAKPMKLTAVLLDESAISGSGEKARARLAVSDDGACAAYSVDYCQLLGLRHGDTIFAGENHPAYSSFSQSDVQWCLMPLRFEKCTLIQQFGAKFLESLKQSGLT